MFKKNTPLKIVLIIFITEIIVFYNNNIFCLRLKAYFYKNGKKFKKAIDKITVKY